jgi:aminoglycoside phosphotransferase (APT) family kinase protein
MPIPAQRDLEAARTSLLKWFGARLPKATDVWVSEISAPSFTGFSNETLMFDAGWTEDGQANRRSLVARVQPTAYSVFLESEFETQYRVMETLGTRTEVRVPRIEGYETDPSVLGAPFFVMDKIEGRIPGDSPPYHTEGWVTEIGPEERESMWWSGLEQMAKIHGLDWRDLGLEFLDNRARGRPGLEQQLAYYEEYFAWAKTLQIPPRPNPVAEGALAWIKSHLPEANEPLQLCWGDSRVGNMIFRDGACVAVLDWEMVTLGNPVQDLAWWLFLDRHHSEGTGVPRLEGFPSYEDTVHRYQDLTGFGVTPEQLRFYEIFAGFRFAVIMMRVIQLAIRFELMPADTDYTVNNIVTQLLARDLEAA